MRCFKIQTADMGPPLAGPLIRPLFSFVSEDDIGASVWVFLMKLS